MSDSGIFKAAVKLPPDQRAAYLDQACGNNQARRQEVESLLRASDKPGSFLEKPAVGGATDAHPPLTERPGQLAHLDRSGTLKRSAGAFSSTPSQSR
jgi:hypothetical protein